MKPPSLPPRPPSLPPNISLIIIIIYTLLISTIIAAAVGDDATVMSGLAKGLTPAPQGWSGSNPCKWSGVKCDSTERVTSITLIGKSISGTLPSTLNQLTNLVSLSLQRNSLSGPLPSLSGLSSLQEVYLDGNAFSSIPSTFFVGLTSLQTFSISENPNLAPWTIPDELKDSASLVSFMASKANVVGSIPDVLGSFPNLQSVRLSYNNLTGSLPSTIAGSAIQNLWLNNQLTGLSGRIDVIGAMTELSQAWLHSNAFSGPIPDLSKCISLFDLQLRDNQLTGIVPPLLSSLPKLVNISLQNNKLQGPQPQFGNGIKASLGTDNNFCNPTPGPCDPRVTTLLEIAGALGYPMTLAESWTGNDPCDGWSFVSCDAGKSVSVINFGKQHFSGTISPAIGNLTSLKSLLLSDNNLTGLIPDSLTKLLQLQLVDVTNNNLSGKIPVFASTVTLKMTGNPRLGLASDDSDGSGSSTSTGSVSSILASSTSNAIVIAAVIVSCLIAVAIVVFFVYKFYLKKRRGRFESGKSSKQKSSVGRKSSYGGWFTCDEPTSESSTGNEHIIASDGGNVVIPIEILREVTNDFSDDNVIGRGGFGIVYKGELHDGTEIAVKRMEASLVSSKGMNEFQAEIGVLTKVRHRHLVGLLGFCVNGNERLLVYEYMPQGTLGQHLFAGDADQLSPLSWKQRVSIALDVARGIEYLHSLAQQSFIHRDLKPSNILLGDDMRAKVSDFGLVKIAPDGSFSLETRLAGTFGYLAPEYAATGKVTVKVDVFAFGVILMEIITGRKSLDEKVPEEQSNLAAWFRRVMTSKSNIRTLIDPHLDPTDEETFESICKVAELAGYCTSREPLQRPDMGHVVNVLSPLVDQWKPTSKDEDASFGVDLHMSLPQALKKWQLNSSSMTSSSFDDNSRQSRP